MPRKASNLTRHIYNMPTINTT